MNPLSFIFGLGVRSRNAFYDRGICRTKRLQAPVVSIGNLSVGGSGKTPFVILLGGLLKSRGIKFDILSRGYKRKTSGIALVGPNGAADDFGDEPLLLSRHLQVPIIVGADRHAAGLFAEKQFGPQIHLLDDGFQHRRLARDFDIVLVTAEDVSNSLLPTGRLREPLSSLHRADAVVLMNGVSPEHLPLEGKAIWRVQREIQVENVAAQPVAFCGIARPQRFMAQLQAAGVTPSSSAFFRDHHAYRKQDINHLLTLRNRHNAGGFVTTEKDVINLGGHLSALQPLAVAKVTMLLKDSDNAVDTLLRIIGERKPVGVRESSDSIIKQRMSKQ